MRRIIQAGFISLDGVIQAPGGPDEDREGGFAHGGWIVPFSGEESGAAVLSLYEKPFELLLGRKTYDIWAPYWPHQGDGNPFATTFNRVRKYVATHAKETLAWNNSHRLGDDVVASLTELKRGEGPDLLLQGSSNLAQTLLAAALIDEFNLMIYPVLLGRGKRLFGDGILPANLTVVSARILQNGVIVSQYRPDGAVRTGSFEG